MNHRLSVIVAACVATALPWEGGCSTRVVIGVDRADGAPAQLGGPGCGLSQAAFCDTFDAASPGGRAGDLDDALWSVARISTAANLGQGQFDAWLSTTMEACGMRSSGVTPDQDILLCAGGGTSSMHMNDSYDDAGGFTLHSFRPRQAFDFANRTGIIAFDVGAKARSPGGHGFWFSVTISEEPVPAPYEDGGATLLYVKNGVGIEFNASPAPCGSDGTHNGVSNFYLERGYQIASKFHPPDSSVKCFQTEEEVLNHIEIHISQSKIEVFASDAGNPQSLRSVAAVDGMMAPGLLPLPFARGYLNFQHVHFDARKFTWTDPTCNQVCCEWNTINDPSCVCHPQGDPAGEYMSPFPCNSSTIPHCSQQCPTLPGYATYHWDNVGFDGPTFPVPRAYEVPDTLIAALQAWPPDGRSLAGGVNYGYFLATSGLSDGLHPGPITIALPAVDLTGAVDAVLTLNAWFPGASNDTIGYRFNGGSWRTFQPPFDTTNGGARAVAIPVGLADLRQGANTLEMNSSSGGVIVANEELTVDIQ